MYAIFDQSEIQRSGNAADLGFIRYLLPINISCKVKLYAFITINITCNSKNRVSLLCQVVLNINKYYIISIIMMVLQKHALLPFKFRHLYNDISKNVFRETRAKHLNRLEDVKYSFFFFKIIQQYLLKGFKFKTILN